MKLIQKRVNSGFRVCFFKQLCWEKSEWSLSLEIMCMHFILSSHHVFLYMCNYICHRNLPYDFPKMRGGRRSFGIFPKIHTKIHPGIGFFVFFPFLNFGNVFSSFPSCFRALGIELSVLAPVPDIPCPLIFIFSTFAYSMSYIFWKLLIWKLIWAMRKHFLSILRGVTFLLTQSDAYVNLILQRILVFISFFSSSWRVENQKICKGTINYSKCPSWKTSVSSAVNGPALLFMKLLHLLGKNVPF